ncbi:hypothetical protein VC83_06766 [Pseudogymnoascus destructans]|uniref:Uncharacterized protein n=1 Tax=Pseudogymnoascus destructans TaxID=655981 RepID=A0A177A2N6_9PEZI|nr:uncharacterized protein VC83_06766 [Pseudogymnoascus destructans]OAF56367.1 hypothetical protein VC83_06766 [Pseudogymnoascus destructans]
MDDISFQRPSDLPNLEEIIAEYDNLEREIFVMTIERKPDSSRSFIASAHRNEDSDRELTIDEVEQKNIQVTRAQEDKLLASNRCKEDAGTALRRIGENKECDLIKSGIAQRHNELKSAIKRITHHSFGQDGQEAMSKNTKNTVSEMSEEGYLVQDNDDSIIADTAKMIEGFMAKSGNAPGQNLVDGVASGVYRHRYERA